MDYTLFATLAFVFMTAVDATGSGSSEHNKIWQDLLQDYDKRVRPVIHSNTVVNISLHMHVDNVVDLAWYDDFLKFDASYYGRQFVGGYTDDIWTPDIILYESLDEDHPGMIHQHPVAEVNHDGLIKWAPSIITTTACKLNVVDYPFDVQVCPLTFGSWIYPNKDIHLIWNNTLFDNPFFVTSGEWKVSPLRCKVRADEYFGKWYDVLNCHFTLTRRPLHYIFNLVVPCIILLIIGSFTFLLPVNSGEKVTLSVTILLAMTVFVLVLMENLPPNSDGIPFLGKFITACIALLAVSTVMAVSVVNMVARANEEIGSSSPPKWMQIMVLKYLAKSVCFSCERNSWKNTPAHDSHNKRVNYREQENGQIRQNYFTHTSASQLDDDFDKKSDQMLILWVDIATVIDRLYLLIYLAIVVTMIGTVFVYSSR